MIFYATSDATSGSCENTWMRVVVYFCFILVINLILSNFVYASHNNQICASLIPSDDGDQ